MPSGVDPLAGAAAPIALRGSAVARAMLRLSGWKLRFSELPAMQGVLIVYPHTSNWDFVLGILAKWAIGLPLTFWGKDTLFDVPLLGRWLRSLGGVPVNRHAPQGIVGQMGDELIAARAQGRFLWLALSPEGTRRRTAAWRSGFYHVACKAQVPVGLAFLDYGRREVGVEHYIAMSGEPERDLRAIKSGLREPRGLRPECASPIRFES